MKRIDKICLAIVLLLILTAIGLLLLITDGFCADSWQWIALAYFFIAPPLLFYAICILYWVRDMRVQEADGNRILLFFRGIALLSPVVALPFYAIFWDSDSTPIFFVFLAAQLVLWIAYHLVIRRRRRCRETTSKENPEQI